MNLHKPCLFNHPQNDFFRLLNGGRKYEVRDDN